MLLFLLRMSVNCVMGATPMHSKSVLSNKVEDTNIIRRVELNQCHDTILTRLIHKDTDL